MMTVTIRDVASVAGVSPSTVSHVLSGNRTVSARTARRVRLAAERLGYRPNRLAAAMRIGRTMVIGAVVPDIGNPYFGRLIAALERNVDQHGFTVMVMSSELDHDSEERHVKTLLDHQVDVIVYFGATSAPNNALITASATSVPIMVADELFDWLPNGLARIDVDNALGGTLAARHLLDLNHQTLGVVSGPVELPTARDRLHGFQQVTTRYTQPAAYAIANDYTLEAGRTAGRIILSDCPHVTGIFAANDLLALGVIQASFELGRNVPHDLSVIGFDDIFVSNLTSPALTTIRQPVERLGREIAEYVIMTNNHFSGSYTVPDTQLPVELIRRESSARSKTT